MIKKFQLLIFLIPFFAISVNAQNDSILTDTTRYGSVELCGGLIISIPTRRYLEIETSFNNKAPNLGFKLGYRPKKPFVSFETALRLDEENHIFNVSLKTTRGQTQTCSFNYFLHFDNYAINNSLINDYYRFTFGTSYTKHQYKIGVILGADNSDQLIGFSGYASYSFDNYFNKCKPRLSEFVGALGYWANDLSYDVRLNIYAVQKIRIGIGYHSLVDYQNLYFNIRYLLIFD